MIRNRRDNINASFARASLLIGALFVALTGLASCGAEAPEATDVPEATEVPEPAPELPEELAFLPEPTVVSSDELTDEILEREAERTTAEHALVVRYPREEFERFYGDVQPLEEQEWWQKGAEGVSPEEYLSSESMVGRTYLATVEQGDSIYVTKTCYSSLPLQRCGWIPGSEWCSCTPLDPPADSGTTTIPADDDTPCKTEILRAQGARCSERTDCARPLGCQASKIHHFGMHGIDCKCPEGTLKVVREIRGE